MNEKFKEMCEKLGIKLMSTGANSPWQAGIVERNHMVVDNILEKLMADQPKVPAKQLLPHAIFAKNSLVTVYGYSPSQLVFGQNPKIPGIPYNQPPANETKIESQIIAERLQSLFSARQGYMQVENSSRLKRALISKIPAPKLIHYELGDNVYYKHGQDNTWKGPAKVIGIDNKIIFLRQGRFILATSQTRIIRADNKYSEKDLDQASNKSPPRPNINENPERQKLTDLEEEPIVSNTDLEEEMADGKEKRKNRQPENDEEEEERGRAEGTLQEIEREGNDNEEARLEEILPENDGEGEEEILQEVERGEGNQEGGSEGILTECPQAQNENQAQPKFRIPTQYKKLVQGKIIWCREKKLRHDKNAWVKFKSILRTRKTTKNGPNKSDSGPYWTVERENGERLGWYEWAHDWYYDGEEERPDWMYNYVNATDQEEDTEMEHEEFDSIYIVFIPPEKHHLPFVVAAKQKELDNFIKYKAYKEVPDIGQARCTSGFIVTEKFIGTGNTGCKARLVVHGNQLSEEVDNDSPTARKMTLRLMLCLAVQYGWRVHSADVTAAFLQSEVMVREVHVVPPKEVRKPGIL